MSESVLEEISSVLEVLDRKTETKRKKTQDTTKKSVKKLTKKQLQIQEMSQVTVLPEHYRTVWTITDLEALCKWLSEQKIVAVDTETTGLDTFRDTIVGISLYAPHQGWYIPLKHNADIKANAEAMAFYKENGGSAELTVGVDYVDCLPKHLVALKLRPLLEDPNRKFLFHNARFDMHILLNWMGIKVKPYFDTMVAAALLDENESKALKDLATKWLKIPSDRFSTLFGKVTFDNIPVLINPISRTGNLASFYAIKDTELTYKLYEFEMRNLSQPGLSDLYSLMFDIEMPFLEIAWEAEHWGVRVDEDYLRNHVAPTLHKEADELKDKITGYIGDINLKSPAQLSKALYEELKLPKVNKKKPTSTDKKTLTKLKNVHPVIPLILEYRSKSKLCDAFADKLPDKIVDDRIHCNFNTAGTKCVAGDTLIVTDKGILPIRDVCSDRVAGEFTDVSLGVYSTEGFTKASAFYYSGVKGAYKINLSDGTEIIVSEKHPLLTNKNLNQKKHFNKRNKVFKDYLRDTDWEIAENLREGDYLALKIGTELYGENLSLGLEEYLSAFAEQYDLTPQYLTEDFALWLGMYTADGSLHDSNGGLSIRLTNDDTEVTNTFMCLNKKLFNKSGNYQSQANRSPYVSLSAIHALKPLLDAGILMRGARNKTVPDVILKAPKNIQQAFIKGLTLDSSTKKKPYKSLYISSVSRDLIAKVRVMLLNMGIYCRLSKNDSTENATCYSVVIKGKHLDNFLNCIGLVERCKVADLEHKRHTDRSVGTIESDDYIFVKVISKEWLEAELFDLEVPSNHSFVGNGVMNHNTGRLSSSNPNLQQMPAGNLIRNAFIADPGRMLVSIDYSGQELRVLTHFSMDSNLLDIYANDKDVHSMTAVSVWNIQHPDEQTTYEYFDYCRNMHTLFRDADGNILEDKLADKEYINLLLSEGGINTTDIKMLLHDIEMGAVFEKVRKKSKVVNFGIIYGMSASGLADTLNITEDEASLYIKAYFAAYPGVKCWMNEMKQQMMHSRGNYTQTLLGRKRRVYPEIQSGKPWLIEKAFRMGINAVIQGSSADMVKKAAIDLQPLLKELDSHIVLFIHDEYVFDVPENIGMENLERISKVMCSAIPLVCGLKADIEAGHKWGQVMSEDEVDALRQEMEGEVA